MLSFQFHARCVSCVGQVLVGAAVNQLCTVSLLAKVASPSLRGCVRCQFGTVFRLQNQVAHGVREGCDLCTAVASLASQLGCLNLDVAGCCGDIARNCFDTHKQQQMRISRGLWGFIWLFCHSEETRKYSCNIHTK